MIIFIGVIIGFFMVIELSFWVFMVMVMVRDEALIAIIVIREVR